MADPISDGTADLADADRGFIAALEPAAAKTGGRQGLYAVAEGIYQVCGLDISHLTLVEGDRGLIVIDPLIRVETAAAALSLYRRHRGDRPVTAVIYTHSHGDHFGGVAGVTDGDVPILAPNGFLEHAATATTTVAPFPPFPPTVDITHTGQEETIDGVRIIFQLTPGTEAPAEMNLFLPGRGALCIAERVWSRYLTEAIAMFGQRADVVFASHHRPTWGRSNIMLYLSEQRDVYAYLHDQTLRLLNKGHTGAEIAELIQLPPALERAWQSRGHQGSVSHNVKAIYQRYLGWFDGNPAGLWPHPPVETARRYVDRFGGVGNMLAEAGEFVRGGDLRFAAQLLRHAVHAEPENEGAKELLAQVYERLGHGTHNATWRDFYLTGAQELRYGLTVAPLDLWTGMASALSIEQLFDTLAIRVDAPAAWHETITIDWHFDDGPYRTTLRHGVLIHHHHHDADGQADLTLRVNKLQLLGLLAGQGLNGISHEGDPEALRRLFSRLDSPDPQLAIVAP